MKMGALFRKCASKYWYVLTYRLARLNELKWNLIPKALDTLRSKSTSKHGLFLHVCAQTIVIAHRRPKKSEKLFAEEIIAIIFVLLSENHYSYVFLSYWFLNYRNYPFDKPKSIIVVFANYSPILFLRWFWFHYFLFHLRFLHSKQKFHRFIEF